ncbi:MAG: 6-bladed beta-propeller [Prevotellaceae bacterium]|jgi:phosphoribosyl-AMP cyclohydrolase|nr:6-bladed beta-propeller [Prevotellaceae bacterium]
MKKNIILGIVLCVIISGCKQNKKNTVNTDYITIAIDPPKALNEVNMSDIFSKVDYIPLETNDECLIGRIEQILVYKDRLYLLDRFQTKSVFCYSKDGKFLYQIDKKGQGPGEYIDIDNISIDHDNDRLLLYFNHNVLEYDLNGNYVKTHHFDIWAHQFTYIGNNCAAFYGGYTTNREYEKENMTPNLFITENYKKVIHTDLYFRSTRNISALIGLFSNFSNDYSGTVSFLSSYNDTVYHLTPNAVKRAYYIDFGKMKKSKSYYTLLSSPTATIEAVNDNNDYCNIRTMTETRTCLFIEYWHRRIFHWVFYYKDTGKIIDVCHDYSNDESGAFPMWDDIHNICCVVPIWTDGHSFYGYIDAYIIAEKKESVTDPEVKKKIENLSEYDNPVIVVMTPK